MGRKALVENILSVKPLVMWKPLVFSGEVECVLDEQEQCILFARWER